MGLLHLGFLFSRSMVWGGGAPALPKMIHGVQLDILGSRLLHRFEMYEDAIVPGNEMACFSSPPCPEPPHSSEDIRWRVNLLSVGTTISDICGILCAARRSSLKDFFS